MKTSPVIKKQKTKLATKLSVKLISLEF